MNKTIFHKMSWGVTNDYEQLFTKKYACILKSLKVDL